jgi:hypothetical protein
VALCWKGAAQRLWKMGSVSDPNEHAHPQSTAAATRKLWLGVGVLAYYVLNSVRSHHSFTVHSLHGPLHW